MKNKWFGLLLTAGTGAAVLTLASAAHAQTTTFGSLPAGTTFGGTGIATDAVEIDTTTSGADTIITLGLEGTPYGPGPGLALPNDGSTSPTAVTYYARDGASPSSLTHGTWNFDYYIGISTGDFDNYTYDLTINNGTTTQNLEDPTTFGGTADINNADQNSENVDFYYPGAPAGIYTIDLEVLNKTTGAVIDNDVITVDAVPDTTSTLALTAITLGGLMFVSRKKFAAAL
ncbi:MAG TPA: hypothetical protein VH595_22420 [Verrucomicrobiae bacterium]|jgi:hypothetical protein|nr:hypothetical protein [Verrucomicrobiae bacterium]